MRIPSYEPHAICAIFPEMPPDDMAALTQSIRANGLRHPIVIFEDAILDGRHRYRACIDAGVEPRFTLFTGDAAAAIAFAVDENIQRRHLDASQRAMCAARLSTLKRGGDRRSDDFQTGNSQFERTQPQAAKDFNVDPQSVNRANRIVNAGDAELAAAVDNGAVSVNDAYAAVKREERAADPDAARELTHEALKAVESSKRWTTLSRERKRLEQEQRHAELAAAPAPIPTGKFGVILADPPWRYDFSPTKAGDVEAQYPTMDIDAICALPIRDLAEDDCVLYLWAVGTMLHKAIRALEAWGFGYKGAMVWVKPSIGMGYWYRHNAEFLLVGVRGEFKPPMASIRPAQVFEAPRRAHSEKPESVYEMLERLYPGEARVELFARSSRAGWQAWGNEVNAGS